MSAVSIDAKQLRRLRSGMKKAGVSFEKGANLMLKKLAVSVQGRARELCPESPTVAEYAKANKSGVTKRDRTAISSGSLRRSITVETGNLEVHIGVPRNSQGGEYGEKMHDERGDTWEELGPKSKQKGATDKFIFKAAEDREDVQKELVDDVVAKFMDEIGI